MSIPFEPALAASVARAGSVEELNRLVGEIEERFGVRAAAAVVPADVELRNDEIAARAARHSRLPDYRTISVAVPFPARSARMAAPANHDVDSPVGQRSNLASQRVGILLERAQASYTRALEGAGLSPEVVTLLHDFVDMTADALLLKRQFELKEAQLVAPASAPGGEVAPVQAGMATDDPVAPLTAAEMAHALHLHENSIRDRERRGMLFSILRPGRKRGQEYPAFQTWPGIVGTPLEATLAALIPAGRTSPVSGTAAYGFFTSPTDLLADLAPLEVLLGRQLAPRAVDPHAATLLADTADNRLAIVLETARTFASSDNV